MSCVKSLICKDSFPLLNNALHLFFISTNFDKSFIWISKTLFEYLEEIGKKCKCCGNEIKAVKNEAATPGATSAGAIATVANPITAYAKVKKDGKGVPKADQKKTPKGTAVNALDMKGASLFGGTIQKR